MSFVRKLTKFRTHAPISHPRWLIVGLGNPGSEYARTRHNVGFMCTNRLAQRAGARFRGSARDRADVADAVLGGVPILFAQPRTYMNESGQAVSRMVQHYHLPLERVLLICDDVDLPFGTVRLRQGGSSGGQKGVKSVIDAVQTSDIPRVRVGIGRGERETKEYVLTEFTGEQRVQLTALCDFVGDVVECVVVAGVPAAMNRFNGAAIPGLTAS